MSTRHALPVLVKSKSGVLTRVVTLSARRALNIHSFAVGEAGDSRISRVTVMVDAAEPPIEQTTKQLNEFVNVLKIAEPDPATAAEYQLLLVRVSANDPSRVNALQIVDFFRVYVADVVPGAVTVETTGSDTKAEALLMAPEPYGIREIIQPDVVTITRGTCLLSERVTAELNRLDG